MVNQETQPTEHGRPMVRAFPGNNQRSSAEVAPSPGRASVCRAEDASVLGGALGGEVSAAHSPRARGTKHVSEVVHETAPRPVRSVPGGTTTLDGDVF